VLPNFDIDIQSFLRIGFRCAIYGFWGFWIGDVFKMPRCYLGPIYSLRVSQKLRTKLKTKYCAISTFHAMLFYEVLYFKSAKRQQFA